MTLIAAKLNRDLGNANFPAKKRLYAQDRLEITRKVLEAEKGTHEEIKNRQNWLTRLPARSGAIRGRDGRLPRRPGDGRRRGCHSNPARPTKLICLGGRIRVKPEAQFRFLVLRRKADQSTV